MCIDQSIKFRDWIPIETSGPSRKRLSILFKWRFLQRRCVFHLDFCHTKCARAIPTFPVAPSDIRRWLSSRSGSSVFLRACVLESRHIILCKWAMQMSYANASRAISRQFVIFLSRHLFIWDYLFLLLLLSPASCSAVMARPVGKTERSWAVYFTGDRVTAHSANWRTFPALENLMAVRIRFAVCNFSYLFSEKTKQRVMARGCCFQKVIEVTSGHSFHFIFLFPEFGCKEVCESESSHNILSSIYSPASICPPLNCQTFSWALNTFLTFIKYSTCAVCYLFLEMHKPFVALIAPNIMHNEYCLWPIIKLLLYVYVHVAAAEYIKSCRYRSRYSFR